MVSDQTLLLIAVILILVDIFLLTDITTLIAYVIFSYLIAHNFEVPILYQVVIGIIAWWVMVAIHYFVFRKIIRRFTDRFIAPTKIKSGVEAHFGKSGHIKVIGNQTLFQIGDELYPFIEQDGKACKHDGIGKVTGYSNGKLIIKLSN